MLGCVWCVCLVRVFVCGQAGKYLSFEEFAEIMLLWITYFVSNIIVRV